MEKNPSKKFRSYNGGGRIIEGSLKEVPLYYGFNIFFIPPSFCIVLDLKGDWSTGVGWMLTLLLGMVKIGVHILKSWKIRSLKTG